MMVTLKSKIKRWLNDLYVAFLNKRIKVGQNVVINGHIFLSGTSKVTIGDNVYINSNERSNPIGGNVRCYFKTLRDGKIFIGDGCRLSNIAITSLSKVEIGSNVYLGGGGKIYDTDFHSLDYNERIAGGGREASVKSAPIRICDGAFIGAHSIILKGVTIGEKAIIGAGSVVTKNIPACEIWAGNPARFIRKIDN